MRIILLEKEDRVRVLNSMGNYVMTKSLHSKYVADSIIIRSFYTKSLLTMETGVVFFNVTLEYEILEMNCRIFWDMIMKIMRQYYPYIINLYVNSFSNVFMDVQEKEKWILNRYVALYRKDLETYKISKSIATS